jgi:hypothetical protein
MTRLTETLAGPWTIADAVDECWIACGCPSDEDWWHPA